MLRDQHGQGKPAGNCGSTISSAAGPRSNCRSGPSPTPGPLCFRVEGASGARPADSRRRGTDDGCVGQPQCRRIRAFAAARTFSTSIGRSRSISSDTCRSAWREIDRAEFDRFKGRFRAGFGERRDHHHRRRLLDHDLAEAGQPVHAGHLDIERHHVGRRSAPAPAHRCRCGPCGLRSRLRPENSFQQFPHQSGIVSDEKLDHDAFDV